VVPNFIKLVTVAEISHLTISTWQLSAILDFLKFDFLEQRLGFGGPIFIRMQNLVEIGGTVAEI